MQKRTLTMPNPDITITPEDLVVLKAAKEMKQALDDYESAIDKFREGTLGRYEAAQDRTNKNNKELALWKAIRALK